MHPPGHITEYACITSRPGPNFLFYGAPMFGMLEGQTTRVLHVRSDGVGHGLIRTFLY